MGQETLSIFLYDKERPIFGEWHRIKAFEQTLIDEDKKDENKIKECIEANEKQLDQFLDGRIRRKLFYSKDRKELEKYLKEHRYLAFEKKAAIGDAFVESETFEIYDVYINIPYTEIVYKRVLVWRIIWVNERSWNYDILVYAPDTLETEWEEVM
jgi:hypothetical protein